MAISKAAARKRAAKNPKFVKKGDKIGYQPVQATAYIGNSWWMRRSKHGRDKIFKTPQIMWEAAVEYFRAQDDNPECEREYKGAARGKFIDTPKKSLYSWGGLAIFCDVSEKYFNAFFVHMKEDDPHRDEYLYVREKIDTVIRENKISGATLGFFKENFVMFDLGMRRDGNVKEAEKELQAPSIEVADVKAKKVLEQTLEELKKIDKE